MNPLLLLEAIELKLYDLRVIISQSLSNKWLKETTHDKNIVVLAYNDTLVQNLNNYPNLNISNWPIERSLWVDVLRHLRRASNNVTVFDARFSAPDKDPYNDILFSNEIKKNGNVILGFSMLKSKEEARNWEELEENEQTLLDVFKLKQSISEKITPLILKKFIHIKKEIFLSNIDFNTFKNIVFSVPQDLMESYILSARDIGIVNIQISTANEVIRENKPLYNYFLSENFALSLPLSTARYVLADYDNNRLSFEKNFLGENLIFGSKVFPLNNNGNIYIDWKGPSNIYQDIPLSKSIAYEKFETMDLRNGYIILPEEQNFNWQSFFNALVVDDIVDIYYQNLNSNFNSFCLNFFGLKFEITDLQNFYNKTEDKKVKTFFNDYEGNLSDNNNLILGKRHDNMFDSFFYNNDYSLINYLESYQYNIKDFTYNYFNNNTNADIVYSGDFRASFKNFDYSQQTCKPIFLSEKFNKSITQKLDIYFDYVGNHLPYYFTNKIVLIGQTQSGTDIHSVPFDNMFPGPKIMTTAIDTFLNNGNILNKTMLRLNYFCNAFIIVLLVYLTIKLMIKRENYLDGFFYFLVLLTIFLITNILCFSLPFIKIWINMTYPVIFMFFAFFGTISFKMNILDRDKKQIKSAFGRFVSPQILESILANPEFISSQVPKKRNISVLFSDIRNFTTYSEKLPPEELVQQLNEYLTEMVEVIINEYNGTFDKFMGDALMAFWGDPMPLQDNAKRSVLTALSMKEHLKLLNAKWEKESKPPFKIGIGINTGEMIVGFSGSPRLRNYTVLGDNVNIASRIEGLNKQFGTDIIISESTYESVQNIVDCVFLGSVTVKGKEKEIKIYSVLNLKKDADVDFKIPEKLYIDTIEDK